MNLLDQLGKPAVLEQCAEECIELAHACLKMARKLRDENPTPASEDDIAKNLVEEIADVLVSIDGVIKTGVVRPAEINATKTYKKYRWENRLKEKLKIKGE